MFDIWGVLLQALTVSGAAALILFIKLLFKNKLPPKWHFAVWIVLGISMIFPAGMFGRYALFRWQIVVEAIKSWAGVFSFTEVLFPIPIIRSFPQTAAEWIFALYVLGILLFIIKYLISYLKLKKMIVKLGTAPCEENLERILNVASEQKIKINKVIEVKELPSAFVFGIFRPVLVIPSETKLDKRIILHELFHLKNKDTVWSAIICAFRCLYWYNPLIVYCANRAVNDMESRTDQYVLEQLKGEERREYGHILLSMANERFSKTPGGTCINNGGKNIRERIENIARFKKYPKGMELVSVCIIILLIFPLLIGTQASGIQFFDGSDELTYIYTRSIACTTPAGAIDTYTKSVLTKNPYYRIMCAPEEMQESLFEKTEKNRQNKSLAYDMGLNEEVIAQDGLISQGYLYSIYNLKETDDDTYEGLLVMQLRTAPNGEDEKPHMIYLAVQNLRIEKQKGRYVTIPLEDFRYVETEMQSPAWGCTDLPGIDYSGEYKKDDFKINLTLQTIHLISSKDTSQSSIPLFSESYYSTVPDPNADFTLARINHVSKFTYTGSENGKCHYNHIGLSTAPMSEGDKRPTDMETPHGTNSSFKSYTGYQWVSKSLFNNWDSTLIISSGGIETDPKKIFVPPDKFAANFYLNNKKAAEIYMTPIEKGNAE